MATSARELALSVLMEAEQEEVMYGRLIRDVLNKYDYMESRDKAFLKRLCDGVTERRIELIYHIDRFSKLPAGRMKPVVRNALLIGAYQILYMDSIQDFAAVNESVRLVKKHRLDKLAGFVNAILRNIARNKDTLIFPDRNVDFGEYISVRYSLPKLIADMWIETYGEEKAEQIAGGLLSERGVSLRFAERLSDAEIGKYITRIEKRGVYVRANKLSDRVYEISGAGGIDKLPGYDEGAFIVQDVSSYLAVTAAGIKAGDTVLDMCAAPGGKTVLAAEYAGTGGHVISRDISADKLSLIEANVRRFGLTNVTAERGDAAVREERYKGIADVLILDVPCSGLGVIGKKPDIKYNISEEKLASLYELQRAIITACADYVKPGGVLLYSTCTINRKENQNTVNWILDNYPYKQVDLNSSVGTQLLPGADDCDGFYYAVLRRI